MRHRHFLPFFLAATGLAAPTFCQSPGAASEVEPTILAAANARTDRHGSHVLHDDAGSGVLWSNGRTWKASFGPDGFTFVPFFGSAAPRNFPVQFRTVAATVGGEAIALAPQAKPMRAGDRITLDRGALRETYDLGLDAVEQSFVIETTRPGDVHLTVAVDTDLKEDSSRPGLQFGNELGHVFYGDAFAVVGGTTQPIRTTWDGACLHFFVPAALRDDGPVVIDPLMGTWTPIGGPAARPERHPDVSFDQSSGLYLLVWENWFSSVDCDVYSEFLDWTGAPLQGTTAVVDNSAFSYEEPAVANLNANDQFLIVCSAKKPGVWNGRAMIYGRMRSTGSGTPTSSEILISDTQYGNDDHVAPDVGGDPDPFGTTNNWCVVWRQMAPTNPNFRLRLVSGSGQPGFTQNMGVLGHRIGAPRISNGNGHGQVTSPQWGVALGIEHPATGNRDILVTMIRLDSGFGPALFVPGPGTDVLPSISSPLAGDAGRTHFLATFERQSSQSAQALVWTIDPMLSNPVPSGPFDLTQMFGYGSRNLAVETDGVRFAVTSSVIGGNNTSAIATVALTPQNTLVEHEGQRVMPGRPAAVRLTSLHVNNAGPTTYLAAYEDVTLTPQEVRVTRYQGYAPGLQLTQRPWGCGGLFAQWYGEPLLAHNFQVVLGAATPHLPMFVLAPLLATPVQLCPSCTIGVDLNAPIFLEVGSPIFSLTVPPNPEYVNLTFGLQGFGLDNGTCLGSLAISDLFEFTIR